MLFNPSGPCKDCSKRNATCHASCKEYADWKGELKDIRETRKRNWHKACFKARFYNKR